MRATVTGATSGTRRRPWRRPADALRSRCGAGLGPVMRSHPATAPPRGFACSWASVVLGVHAGIPVTCSAKFVDAPVNFALRFRRTSDALAR